jgi:hypothetical protein
MFICLTKSLLELVPGSLTDVVVGTYPSLSFASSPNVTSKLCLALPRPAFCAATKARSPTRELPGRLALLGQCLRRHGPNVAAGIAPWPTFCAFDVLVDRSILWMGTFPLMLAPHKTTMPTAFP